MKSTVLKGGSLSKTELIETEDETFVRKSVSLIENLEYGYGRWYSQLKRLQRYNYEFPGYYPEVLRVGKTPTTAYYDMEYVKDSYNLLDYIVNHIQKKEEMDEIVLIVDRLLDIFHDIHQPILTSYSGSPKLYVWQEVRKSLDDCNDPSFQRFGAQSHIVFNGQLVESFIYHIDKFEEMFIEFYDESFECFSHGNATLENMLYIPEYNEIVFIDVYEENVLDSRLADYSQVLQSSNAKYELLNEQIPEISGQRIHVPLLESKSLEHFNDQFIVGIQKQISDEAFIATRLLEISQFIRMLPFKQEIDVDKMKMFYGLASKLFEDLRNTV